MHHRQGVELVNVHGGRDFFSAAEVNEYFSGFLEMERRYHPLPIAHETHRSRILYSPWVVGPILDKFPSLKLVADLSHFVCVAECIFDCKQLDDVVSRLAANVVHIHARVGFEEGKGTKSVCIIPRFLIPHPFFSKGPQVIPLLIFFSFSFIVFSIKVADPRDPRWLKHVEHHEMWWKMIFRMQKLKQVNLLDFGSTFSEERKGSIVTHCRAWSFSLSARAPAFKSTTC